MNKENIITSQDNKIQVSMVKAFSDNYIWFIHGFPENNQQKQKQQNIIIVDPGDAAPVIQSIEQNNYQPEAIFITHHHADHTGGISKLVQKYAIPVYGPANETISDISHPVSESDRITLPSSGLTFSILDVPGHTKGHIAFLGYQCLFIGDTLFAGGCGRIFEGTPEQMHLSLSKLLALDDDTLIYCAHEYTQENLVFAKTVEPDNVDLIERIEKTDQLRKRDKATVPSSLAIEKLTNPFLRFNNDSVTKAAEGFARKSLGISKQLTPAEVFKITRYWKDTLD